MHRTTILAATAILASPLLPGPAAAQDAARLNAIEAQIRGLQAELGRVRREMLAKDAELRTARQEASRTRTAQASARPGAPSTAPASAGGAIDASPAQSSTPAATSAPASTSASAGPTDAGGVSFPQGRPTFTSDDKRFSAAIGAQVHYDIGGYFQGDRNPDTRSVTRLNTFGENLRRARLPVVFKYDDFQINITPDFGGSPDGSPTLYEANFNWTPIKGLTATIGYYKPQLTLQDSMSSNDFLLLERPSIVEIARTIAAGDSRSVVGARYAADRYFLAGYLTGGTFGSQTAALATPQQTGIVARAAGRPVATDDWDVHVGFSASDAFRIQRTAAGQTLTIQDRPELRIDQNRLISTGAINARSANEYGPEFGIRYRNLLLQGEYIRVGVQRNDGGAAIRTPGLTFSGGYAEASWVITGEPRRYVASSGAFGSPKPVHPFSIKDGGAGAFELVGRFSTVDLNDRVTRGLAAVGTGGVYGGSQTIYAAGLNWYPNENLRLMLDYDFINVDRLNAAGTTQIGQRVQAVAMRAQAAF